MATAAIPEFSHTAAAKRFLESDLSATNLARNPNADLAAAITIQSELNRFANAGIDISGLNKLKGSLFQDTTILSEFHSEQQRLRQEFVDTTVGERFGRQDVTSVSSTVNAQGVRTPIGGQRVGTTPTSAQLNAISAEFKTPLVGIAGSKFAQLSPLNQLTSSVGSSLADQTRTIVGGAGVQRRRAPSVSTAPTILTSDSDAQQGKRRLGSPTILG